MTNIVRFRGKPLSGQLFLGAGRVCGYLRGSRSVIASSSYTAFRNFDLRDSKSVYIYFFRKTETFRVFFKTVSKIFCDI